jgi:8-oxo-dGTP pyrophosphatase MutT (NUDIX family)
MKENLRRIISTRKKKTLVKKGLTRAAVLVPIFFKENEYHILLTQRSHHVLHHKGEISFPGGKRSKSDSSYLETALRESWEEIRLNPKDTEILGELDDVQTTNTGFIISPFIAFIPYPYEFVKDTFEIKEILDIPVSSLLETCNLGKELPISTDESETKYCFNYQGMVIWGATAKILNQLLEIIQSAGGAQ